MDYHVTLDPHFGLSAFDFIITWNATPECRTAAMARTVPLPPVLFNQSLVTGTVVVLSRVESRLAVDVIFSLIEVVLRKRGVRQNLKMDQTDLPDGGQGISVESA
jgi:hypothetical protein